MKTLRFGIIGTGMIAEVITQAIHAVEEAVVTGVCSRLPENAQSFAERHRIPHAYPDWKELLQSDEIDAVYLAAPTIVKEEIALAAARAKKHVLIDKPFLSLESATWISETCQNHHVAFMDGTHFVHHPRTHHLKRRLEEEIGSPQALISTFFFPFMETHNIRFQPKKEPKTAVGDMAWYCMRAIVEYMPKAETIEQVCAYGQRLEATGSIIRGAGMMRFNDELTSTFNFGYNAGVCLMDLDILGQTGSIYVDDFVLDWQSGFPFDHPDHPLGYTKKFDMNRPQDCTFVPIPNPEPQTQRMIKTFVQLTQDPSGETAQQMIRATLKTQRFLESLWDVIQ